MVNAALTLFSINQNASYLTADDPVRSRFDVVLENSVVKNLKKARTDIHIAA